MNKLLRLFSIIDYLVHKERVTAGELAEKMSVSKRTIRRDIEQLSSLNIPIYMKTGRNGGICILDSYTISKSLILDEEKEEVLKGLRLLHAVGLSDNDVLESKLANIFSAKTDLRVKINFSGWGNEIEQEKLEVLSLCMSLKKTAEINYIDAKNEASNREIILTELEFRKNAWYLSGFCLARQEIRLFKLKRIQSLSVGDFYEEELYDTAMSLQEKEGEKLPCIKVKMRVEKAFLSRLKEEIQYEICANEETLRPLICTMQPAGDWLVNYLLSFGGAIEVLSPKFLREQMITEIDRMNDRYKY